MEEFELKELVLEDESPFPTKKYSEFDGYTEYYMLKIKEKQVYGIRSINGRPILIDLKRATPILLDNFDFLTPTKEKLKDYIRDQDVCLVEIPHYGYGASDYTSEIDKKIKSARKKFFQYLIDEGYFD